VRKISSGNPLPPFRVGTTTDYRWTPASGPGSSFATADPVEGMLVRVNGPLRVARVGPGAGLPANTAWLCVNADGSAPGDSIYVDGYQLTSSNIIGPALGTTVDWVRGIMRRASPGGVDAWIISLRGPDDQSVQAPPNLSEAYPIAENKLRLTFDKNLDLASAQNPANYSLGSKLSGSTVDNAVVLGGSGTMVDLTITDVLPRLTVESIQSKNIGSATCPACLSPAQSLSFILGILSCLEVQTPLVDSLMADPCLDKSRFAGPSSGLGERVTVRGVLVHWYGGGDNLFYMQDAGGGPRTGVAAYNVPFGPVEGHQYLLAARVQEYYGMTELNNPVAMIDEGFVGVPAPYLTTVGALADQSCDPNQETLNAEDFEDVLVRVENAKVVPFNTEPYLPQPGGSFRVVGLPERTDTLLVSNSAGSYTFAADTSMVLNINGCLYFSLDRGPRLWPRSNADIAVSGTGVEPGTPIELALGVSPNPGATHRISFALPRKTAVKLGVYDVLGRRVAVLAEGELPAGRYTREWDGRSRGGLQSPAGVYFYRLEAGPEVRTFRAVKLD